MTRRIIPAAAVALTLAFGVLGVRPRAEEPAPAIKLEVLKWDAFTARLATAGAQKYKYTLVDAWSTTCGPCKENFPHLVEMNEKYGRKGLQVVSLSLDDITDKKAASSPPL